MTGPSGDREDTATFGGAARAVGSGDAPTLPPRWRAQREIGRGGQATVWLARDAELDTPVAIKVFKADLTATQRERLRREVLLGRTLQHPGLVRVYELIDGGDRLAVAMEWVPEGSLAQRLEAGPLAVDEVVRVAEQVLESLAYLHEHGVVHRDVKPSNLLVDSDGRVRLADLGLARPLEDDRGLTRTLAAVGTPAYMSPEQIRGEPPAPATDLYGLGVTLYQLVTGALPFSGTSEFDVANKHLTTPVGDPRKQRRDCPAWLAAFVLRLLEKAPRDRFASAGAALAALGRRRRAVSPRTWRRAAGLALAAAIVAAAALWAGHAWTGRELATATVAGRVLTARDAGGSVLWEREFADRRPAAVVGDFIGGPEPEVAVGLLADGGQKSADARVLVLDRDGRQVASLPAATGLYVTPYNAFSDRVDGARPFGADLDGDGRQELVWTAHHQVWYPALVAAWSPRTGVEPSPILINSGHFHTVRTADVDGDGVNEIVAVGQNNPLGWQRAVAVIDVERAPAGVFCAGSSPDLVATWTNTIFNGCRSLRSYTVLGPRGGGDGLVAAGPGFIEVNAGGQTVRLDGDGNPEGSPLHGRGPGPRTRLWDDLAALCREAEFGRPDLAAVEGLRLRHAPALSETPMRLAADLMLARALAAGGDHAGAVTVLRQGLALLPDDLDLHLRLGEQLAIAGERLAAMTELARAARVHTYGRSPFDANLVWVVVASLEGNEVEVGKATEYWRGANSDPEAGLARAIDVHAVWAFCRGDWDDASLQERRTTPDVEFVAVLREWAALERGGAPVAAQEAAERLASNPEHRNLAATLAAYALVRAGRADAAREPLATVIDALTRQARTDVLAHAWLALAHRVSGEAALATGDRAGAAAHFRRAAALAPRCWFGRPPRPPRASAS